jgi:methylated-DNA-[protein]-cysteine S-methyltransferase
MHSRTFTTDLGPVTISWNQYGLTAFRLGEKGARGNDGASEPTPPHIAELIQRAQNHFAGQPHDFSDAALDWSQVTPFQKRVYVAAQAVKAGQTTTYGAIARQLGLSGSGARAVGSALGANPWLLVVPCHRVVAANGNLTGFSAPGGVRTKARMLSLEEAELLAA